MWFAQDKDNNLNTNLYISLDGRSIGLSFYVDGKSIYKERRIHISSASQKPIEILFKDVLYAFKHTNTTKIDKITVILESPWVKEVSTNVKEKRLRSFQINKDTVNEIIQKDSHQTSPQNNDVFSYNLGYTIESIKLNGYNYKDPIGKITEEIEVAITRFWGDSEIINLVKKIIEIFWNKIPIYYEAGPAHIMRTAKNKGVPNALYTGLHSTDTSFFIYSQGIIQKKIHINFGLQNIIGSLSTRWGMSGSETINWIELFLAKSLESNESKRIENDIRIAISPLITYFSSLERDKILLGLERPIYVYGPHEIWSTLFIFLLKNKYFGEVFPHIENTTVELITVPNQSKQDDLLVGLYTK